MIVSRVPPVAEPRPFGPEELFFSTTDEKGRIRYGNRVFTRVSGYTEEELLGQPHNIIRHPHVPRCVFKLLWDYLEAGKSIAAYVKNLAKDGRYYWVLATITPSRGGYLSVRLKPSTALFQAAKEVYASVLEQEQMVESRLGKHPAIEKSTELLLDALKGAGFADYDEFMRAALCEELHALRPLVSQNRVKPSANESLGEMGRLRRASHSVVQRIETLFDALSRFHKLGDDLFERHTVLDELGKSLTFSSLNANLAASRLGVAGATLSVISRSLGERSKETDQMLGGLMSQMGPLCHKARAIAFDVAVAELQGYVAESYTAELQGETIRSNPEGVREGIESLGAELLNRCGGVIDCLRDLLADVQTLRSASAEVSKQVERMQVVQLNGRIEVAAQTQAGAFTGIFDDIGKIIEESRGDCQAITAMLDQAAAQIGGLLKLAPRVSSELNDLRHAIDGAVTLTREDQPTVGCGGETPVGFGAETETHAAAAC